MRILDLLRTNGESRNIDMVKICINYRARISEMRKDGHIILAQRVSETVWRYIYMGQKEDDQTSLLKVD